MNDWDNSTSRALTGWRWALQADPDRPTRFHTLRRQWMPTRAWLDLPKSLFRRLRGVPLEEPWIAPGAVHWLERQLGFGWQVLEVGSGASTTWLALRTEGVISLEDDESWWRKTRDGLLRAGVEADLRLVALDSFADELEALTLREFDLVVIDCNESTSFTRMDCLSATQGLVRPGGYLLLDDSDRPEYGDADRILSGWAVERFVGVRQFPLVAVETSIYQRPADN